MRKIKNITLIEDGRELRFQIKQMSAMELARWCGQALCLLTGPGLAPSGGEDPADFAALLEKHGKSGALRALMGLDMDKVQPLIDGLLACCSHISGPNSLTRLTPDILDGIISDLGTLMRLLAEALAVNLDFFNPEGDQTASPAAASPSGSQAPETLRFNLAGEQVSRS